MLQSQLINKRKDLDPDFGKGIVPQSIVHVVNVQRAATDQRYMLVVMIPDQPFQDGGVGVVHFLMDCFLEKDDHYMIMNMGDGIEISKEVPIISFDPDSPSEFFWITPPPHLWH